MDKLGWVLTILGLFVVGAVAVPVMTAGTSASAAGQYEISIEGSVETPARTVTFQDRTHEVSAVGVADPGEAITVDVTAPDESYRVYVYNGDEQIVESKQGRDDGTFSFDLSNYDPGTYVITAYYDGHYEAIYPVVVRGYDVRVDHPGSVTAGESVEVTAELTETTDTAAPDSVEVALADADSSVNVTATRESDSTYTATVPTDGLEPGTYDLYAGVRTTDTAFGERAIVGVSGASTVEIADRDPSSSPPPSTTTRTTTATQTTAETATTTETATPTRTTTQTTTTTRTTTPTTRVPTSETTAPTTTDDSVLTPNATTDESASTGQPGLGPVGAALAIVTATVLAARRRY